MSENEQKYYRSEGKIQLPGCRFPSTTLRFGTLAYSEQWAVRQTVNGPECQAVMRALFCMHLLEGPQPVLCPVLMDPSKNLKGEAIFPFSQSYSAATGSMVTGVTISKVFIGSKPRGFP